MRRITIDDSPYPPGDAPLVIEPHRCYQIEEGDGAYTMQVTGIRETTVYGMMVPGGQVVKLERVHELAKEGRIQPAPDDA